MKVKTLLEKLATCSPDADVFVYSHIDEGGDGSHRVLSAEEAKENLYFKGDAPWDEEADNFVVIS